MLRQTCILHKFRLTGVSPPGGGGGTKCQRGQFGAKYLLIAKKICCMLRQTNDRPARLRSRVFGLNTLRFHRKPQVVQPDEKPVQRKILLHL